MADTYTTNLNLTKPEPGAAEDTWGISLNADLDALDAIFSTSGTQINLNPNQINFADNKKAIFGTGADLQIYHDGSHSYISENGTGNLILKGGGQILLKSPADENMIVANGNGAVNLFYDNAVKFATTSSGIDVTGTVVSDGLTVDGVGSLDNNGLNLELSSSNTGIIYDAQNGYHTFKRNGTNALQINGGNGDIAFYDDTGSTQGLFWDASAESLGIGTTSPSEKLTVAGIVKSNGFSTNTAGVSNFIAGVNAGSSIISGGEYNTLIGDEAGASITTGDFNVAVGTFALDANTTSSENTAIGYASLSNNITGARNVASGFRALQLNTASNDNTATGYFALYSTTGSNNTAIGKDAGKNITTGSKNTIIGSFDGNEGGLDIRTANNHIVLSDGDGNPRQVINSSGNVGIGTTSPNSKLTVSDVTSPVLELNRSGSIGNGWIKSTDSSNNVEAAIQMYNGEFRLYNNGSQNVTITSSGNLLVGKTAANSATQGVEARVSGQLFATSDSAKAIFLNRLNSDGDIVDFRKDGTTVGSIGANSGRVYIGSGNSGIRLDYGTGNAVVPSDASGNLYNDGVDLGTTAGKFKDLHLSGTGYFGTSVGIGTSSPSYTLDVRDDSNIQLKLSSTTATNNARMVYAINNVTKWNVGVQASDGSYTFYDNSSATTPIKIEPGAAANTFVVDTNSRIGIGTSSPSSLLHLSSSAPVFTLTSTSGNGGTHTIKSTGINGDALQITAENDIYLNGDNIYFRKANETQHMRLTSTGNLGIGTSSPSATLEVATSATTDIDVAHFSNSNGAVKAKFSLSPYTGAGELTLFDGFNNADVFISARTDSYFNSGNVGIGTTSPSSISNYKILEVQGDTTTTGGIYYTSSSDNSQKAHYYIGGGVGYLGTQTNHPFAFTTNNTERARFDSSGNFLVSTTSTSPWTNSANSSSDNGIALRNDGIIAASAYKGTANNGNVAILNRTGTDGGILSFYRSGTAVGNIGCPDGANGSQLVIAAGPNGTNTGVGLRFTSFTVQNIIPCYDDGSSADNYIDLGNAGARFDDIYATNGTINTSDRNQKQDIQALTDAEQRVATACKGLIRRFRWQDAVEEKGDDARLHFGVIAQDLQDAFTAEGLDAGNYGMFISSTWTDETTGEEKTRLGVRYNELLAFIIAAI